MELPKYIVMKVDCEPKSTTVTITDISDRCEVIEHEAEQTEPQQVVRLKHFKCPKCGRSDYIRSFEDWGVDGGIYKYKCINCNTYIKNEPQTERSE